MISIIIPCFNGYRYIDRCLASLERQTYKDFEVVVCDDCSTDDSFERLKAYFSHSSLNNTLIRNSKNVGPGESRNKAIDASKGDFLMFCDCDDWYEDNALEIMVNELISNDADLVMADNYYCDASGRKQKRNSTSELIGCEKKEKQIALARMSLCRLIVKRALFHGVRIPSIYNGEDGAVVPLLLAISNKSIFIEDAIYNYYVRDGSGSTKPLPRVYKGLLDSFANVESAISDSYPQECEFIGIKTVLYGAVFNAIKANVNKRTISAFVDDFNSKHVSWKNNMYYRSLARNKRLFLFFVRHSCFFLLRFYTLVHIVFEKRMSRL